MSAASGGWARSAWPPGDGLDPIARAVAGRGGRLLVTGGAVRDAFIGRCPTDFDAVATLGAEAGRAALAAAGIAREPHPFLPDVDFVTVAGEAVRDVSLTYVGAGEGGLAEDARSRDFACNAVYLDAQGSVEDPLGGLADLSARLLRPASAGAFARDPVRILRYPRMLRRLGNGAEAPGARALMRAAAPAIPGCPPVRVVRELSLLLDLTSAEEAVADVGLLADVGALGAIFPEADVAGFAAYCRSCAALGLEEGEESPPRIGVLGRRPGKGYDARVAAWGDRRDDEIAACADAVESGAAPRLSLWPGRLDALLTHARAIRVGSQGGGDARG